MDVVQEMYSYKYKMYLHYTSKNMDENFAKIAKVLDDILLGISYSRSKEVEVYNLFLSTRYSGMNIAGFYEFIERYSNNFVSDRFSTFSFDELKGLEEYLESWKRYLARVDKLETLLRVWNKDQEAKDKIINYNWFASTEAPFIPKESISKTMLKIWEKNMKNVRKALICSVFKSLREKEADMKRAKTLIQFLFDSIATMESILEYEKGELYKIIVVESYADVIRDYYQKESYLAKSMFSCREYIQKCSGIFDFEIEIAKRYLPESVEAVFDALGNTLIIDYFNVLFPEFKSLVDNDNLEGMQKIYRWMKQSPEAMNGLKRELQLHEEALFCDLRKTCNVSEFCEAFNIKYREEMSYIAKAFDSATDVVSALDKGIFGAINMTLNAQEFTKPNANVNTLQVTDLLANYCDKFMKTGTNGLNEVELEKKLDDIINIFRYVHDKDIFGKLYAKHLSKRLIFSLSQSLEAEEMMIKKFKSITGYTFTKCLEKMITDSELSKELTYKFNNESGLSLSFNVLIMQTGSWPIKASASSLLVPQELAKSFQYFNELYLNTFKGRKLYWHHDLSTCDIKLNYLSKSYTIQTSVNITTVLAIFNNVDSATFEEIRAMTNINAQDLFKYLQFLSAHNIMLSNGEMEKSQFSLNPQYENKRAKFKLMPILKEAAQESKETTKSVKEDRKPQLQALIIRIMKAKKTMNHKDLSNDIVEQLMKTFVPSQDFIKEVVEGLIHKQYLERAKDETDTYNYVA